jgi:hypothetical protein
MRPTHYFRFVVVFNGDRFRFRHESTARRFWLSLGSRAVLLS